MERFGDLLVSERRRRRLSQEALGLLAGVSQRHISYLERGKATAGPRAIHKLIDALDLDFAAANRLLAAAGLAPARPSLGWDDPGFATARHAVQLAIAHHEPFPGIVTDRGGDVIERTAGIDALLAAAALPDAWTTTGADGRPNLYDLSLHPDGIVGLLVNPDIVVPHTLARLEAAADTWPEAARTLARARTYPAAQRWPASSCGPLDAGVVTEHYRVGEHDVRLVAVVAAFGSPDDVTAQATQIELLYPADATSERAVRLLVEEAVGRIDDDTSG
jgi:transcriptional regulator with XRE-family HTH domain